MRRRYSLKGKRCFSEVFEKGQKVRGKFVLLYYTEKCSFCDCGSIANCSKRPFSMPDLKIGIIVTKRFGKAYIRNRAKRVFREAFNVFINRIQKKACMAVILFDNFKNAKLNDVVSDFGFLLKKSKIIAE